MNNNLLVAISEDGNVIGVINAKYPIPTNTPSSLIEMLGSYFDGDISNVIIANGTSGVITGMTTITRTGDEPYTEEFSLTPAYLYN